MQDQPTPADGHVIQLHLDQLRQMFNSMDPAPFHSRDLDPDAETFIVDWARDLPRNGALTLRIHVDASPADPNEQQLLKESISGFFDNRMQSVRRQLRLLFERGRVSLLIGIAFLSLSLLASEMLGMTLDAGRFTDVLRESLLIGGWVAMWRPLEIFLYDWWPLRAEISLFARLRDMPVSIGFGDAAA